MLPSMYDSESRYHDMDYSFCVFVTPRQVQALGIGFDISDYQGCEDDVQPFVVDALVEMAREHLLGAKNGSCYRFPVEKAACCVTLCLDINGKLCRLQREELDGQNPLRGVPLANQVKMFQRLLSEQRISLDDLAVADVDLGVYKELCVNSTEGEDKWQEVLIKIAKWIVEQKSSKKWGKYFKAYIGTDKMEWWEEMSFDIDD